MGNLTIVDIVEVSIGILGIVYYHRSPEAITVLVREVRMIPEGTRLWQKKKEPISQSKNASKELGQYLVIDREIIKE